MLDNKKWEIEGLKEVAEALESLPAEFSLKLIRSVNRKALSKHIVNPLRSAVPYSNDVKKNIKIVSAKGDKTGVLAGPTTKDSYKVRFAEKGTAERYTESGAYRGRIIGNNTITPLIENSVDDVIQFARDEYAEEMIKIMARKLKHVKKTKT